MREFFKTKTFISICVLAVLLLGMMIVSSVDRGRVSLFEDFVGIVITPIQNAVTTISDKAGDFGAIFTEHDKLKEENEKLKEEVAALEQQARDGEQAMLENEALKGILDIKQDNPDFEFCPALVVASEQSGYSYTVTLNKGSADGIARRDVVITSDGVAGYVSEVGTTWCKVVTILDSSCEMGVMITRTQDIGVLEGDFSLAADGLCRVSYLANDVQLNSGDSVVTSGIGGVFPAGLLIGNVQEIKPENHGISQYAITAPSVDLSELENVFVITGFTEDKLPQKEEPSADGEGKEADK